MSEHKIDCSNILNFKKEWDRRNEYLRKHNETTYIDLNDLSISDIVLVNIIDLQKWSDNHPQITRKEKFKKLMKNNGFERLVSYKSQHEFENGCIRCINATCDACRRYWNEGVDE